ncbi:VOC family protein OS=Streptomyces fumanus OX=67302 GN=GCM10018772_54910 PE=4 SV=1 [Streptomyces fumanus]
MDTAGFTTCLWFDDQARGGRPLLRLRLRELRPRRDHPLPRGLDAPRRHVMTVDFTANGQKFVALNGGPQFTFTEAVSFR